MKNKTPFTLAAVLLLALHACTGSERALLRRPMASVDKNVSETVFSDIQMLQKQTHREKAVAVEIVFLGGVQNYSANLDGIEALALLTVLNGSSTDMLQTEIQSRLRALGAVVGYRVGLDYSAITLQTTEKNFAAAWQALMQQVLSPLFDSTEFNAIKADYVEQLKQAEAQPHHAEVLTSLQKLLGGHPYIRVPEGTAANVAEITLDSVQAHYAQLVWKNRMRVVSAASMNPLKVQRELIGTLTMLQVDKKYAPVALPAVSNMMAAKPVFEAGEMEGGVVRGLFEAPAYGTREAVAAELALAILTAELEEDLCQKRRIACGVAGGMVPLRHSFGSFYFATEVPNPSIQALKEVVKAAIANGFTPQQVEEKRGLLLTQYYSTMQTSSGQAQQLAQAVALGDWRQQLGYAQHLKTITVAEVNVAAKKYFTAFKWAFVGNTGKVGRGAFDMK